MSSRNSSRDSVIMQGKCFDAEGAEHGYHHETFKLQAELLKSGEYSDMTITCNGETFPVHKFIVCPRSAFFATALKNFKEANTQTVNLPEDDPHIVKMMLDWMYQGKYLLFSDVDPLEKGADDHGPDCFTSRCEGFCTGECECGRDSGLPNLAKLYVLADKCIIPGLKETALATFKEHIELFWNHKDLPAVTEFLFKHTMEDDEIRKVVSNTIAIHARVADKPEFKRLFDECEGFGVAVFSRLGKISRALKRRTRCKSPPLSRGHYESKVKRRREENRARPVAGNCRVRKQHRPITYEDIWG